MFMAAPAAAERYALEVIGVDAVAVTTTIVGHERDEGLVRVLGMSTAIVGAPLVHVIKGNHGGALKSLALRATLPIALAWGARQIEPNTLCGCNHEEGVRASHVAGFVAGVVIASAIDSAAFAKQPKTEWQPTLAIGRGGAQVGFAATF